MESREIVDGEERGGKLCLWAQDPGKKASPIAAQVFQWGENLMFLTAQE